MAMDWTISWSKSESKAGENGERERGVMAVGLFGMGGQISNWGYKRCHRSLIEKKKKKILLRHWGKGERCLKLVRPVKTLLVERFNCRLREVPSSFKVERFWRLNWAVIGPGLWLGRSDHLLWPTFKIVPLNLLRYRKIE